MANHTFAERLKEALNNKQMKQVDLVRCAQEQGVKLGKSHVSQYLSGKTIPRAEILHFISGVLDVTEEWLMGNGDAEKRMNPEVMTPEAEKHPEDLDGSSEKGAEGMEQTVEEGRKVREFKKSSKLDNVLYDVRGPVVEEASRMEAAGTQVLKLNIGNPAPFGFRTPDEVIYDMRDQLTDCEGYSASKGLFFSQKSDHAVCTAEENPKCQCGGYLYRKWCQ